jgi:hypothetical protein
LNVKVKSALQLLRPDAASIEYFSQLRIILPQNVDQFIEYIMNIRDRELPAAFRFAIGSCDINFNYWPKFKDECCIFDADESKICAVIVQAIENFAIHPVDDATDGAEMTVTGIVDSLLNIFSIALHRTRERNTSISTSGCCRPDYSLGICFVGEDRTKLNYKKGKVGHDPIADLESTTPFKEWSTFFGDDIPFIFAYSAIGSRGCVLFTLGVLDRQSESFRPLHSPINILLEINRPVIMKYALAILPFLIAIDKEVERHSTWTGFSERTSTSFFPHCTKIFRAIVKDKQRVFEKKWNFSNGECALELKDRLTAIFDRMKNHPDELAFCVHPDLPSLKLDPENPCSLKGFFLPFGEHHFVTTIEEAVACVLDVSHSVAILIQLGIVHHDISLDNIMKKGDKYFLVDFDDAAFIGSNGFCSALDVRRLSPEKHCPKTFTEHGHEVDIWSIGRILTLFRVTSGRNELVALGAAIQEQYETISIAEVIVLVRQLL